MFEDSLVESQGRIRTRSKGFAFLSFLVQALLLLALILLPYLHPQALPKQLLQRLLIAPPPPRAPAPVEVQRAAPAAPARSSLPSVMAQLEAPTTIPTHAATIADPGPPSSAPIGDSGSSSAEGILGALPMGAAAPVVTVAKPAAPRRPMPISSGVAAGQLLGEIRPVYPAIAKAARIGGTVILEATISRSGAIENLRVVDGPAMLRQAAIDAVAPARYRPFLLNGEPIEVQTSIHVIFSIGG